MNRSIVFFITVFTALHVLGQKGVSHRPYDELLQKYVNDQGLVDYKGLGLERPKLKSYLRMLEANKPKEDWSEEEKLAYWINAYNAYTLELILQYYPVESIRDIGAAIQIPFVNTPWKIKFIKIGGEEMDLDKIEHGIIRKQFEEPRIHFALVCAAISCPKLQNSAFLPETLDQQLTNAAKDFLADKSKNDISDASRVKLSKLFNWYRGDFVKKMSLQEYISQYSTTELSRKTRIDYMDYDWSLNEQKKSDQ